MRPGPSRGLQNVPPAFRDVRLRSVILRLAPGKIFARSRSSSRAVVLPCPAPARLSCPTVGTFSLDGPQVWTSCSASRVGCDVAVASAAAMTGISMSPERGRGISRGCAFDLRVQFRCCCRRRLSARFSSSDPRLARLDGILLFTPLRHGVFCKDRPVPCVANCSFARVSLSSFPRSAVGSREWVARSSHRMNRLPRMVWLLARFRFHGISCSGTLLPSAGPAGSSVRVFAGVLGGSWYLVDVASLS